MATVEIALASVQAHAASAGSSTVEVAEANVQLGSVTGVVPTPATVEVALASVQAHAALAGGATVEVARARVEAHVSAGSPTVFVVVSSASIQLAGALTYTDGLLELGSVVYPFVRHVSIGGVLYPPRS